VHIGAGNHHRKPGPPNLLKLFERGRGVPPHIAGQCWGGPSVRVWRIRRYECSQKEAARTQ
jgi:hypothetical protein